MPSFEERQQELNQQLMETFAWVGGGWLCFGVLAVLLLLLLHYSRACKGKEVSVSLMGATLYPLLLLAIGPAGVAVLAAGLSVEGLPASLNPRIFHRPADNAPRPPSGDEASLRSRLAIVTAERDVARQELAMLRLTHRPAVVAQTDLSAGQRTQVHEGPPEKPPEESPRTTPGRRNLKL